MLCRKKKLILKEEYQDKNSNLNSAIAIRLRASPGSIEEILSKIYEQKHIKSAQLLGEKRKVEIRKISNVIECIIPESNVHLFGQI